MNNEDIELFDIDEQLKQLQQRRQAIIAEKKQGVIEEVKGKIKQYGITLKELGYADSSKTVTEEKSKANKAKAKAPLIYQDPENSNNKCSKFGPKPAWFKERLAGGCTLNDLLINKLEVTE